MYFTSLYCLPFHCSSILLGTKGFDVPRLSEKLDRLDTAKTFEPLEPVRETDIQVHACCPLYIWDFFHSGLNLFSLTPWEVSVKLFTCSFLTNFSLNKSPLPANFQEPFFGTYHRYFQEPHIACTCSLEGRSPWKCDLKV